MINETLFEEYLEGYKMAFHAHWKFEKYKWIAVSHFHSHWNIEAEDFAEMLNAALAKTSVLLASGFAYPKAMLVQMAKDDPEAVRTAMRNLFDETRPLDHRVDEFIAFADDRKENHNPDGWKNHFQSTNSISVYLWLRYPDKYFVYKYTLCRALAKAIGSTFMPRRNASAQNMIDAFGLYREVAEQLQKDEEIRNIVSSHCQTISCSDDKMYTAAIDYGFYIGGYLVEDGSDISKSWFPNIKDYHPAISVDDWTALLQDKEVFNDNALTVVKRFFDFGGAAACKQLAERYGESPEFYSAESAALAKRIAEKTHCAVIPRNSEDARYWPILYIGNYSNDDSKANFVWKLRDELYRAIEAMNMKETDQHSAPAEDKADVIETEHSDEPIRYWWLNANPKIWSFNSAGVGEEQCYTLYNDKNHKRRIFDNFLKIKAGDIIIGYESQPVKQIVSLAKATRGQNGTDIAFIKTEALNSPIDYSTLQACKELAQMEFMVNPQGSLFKLTEEEYIFIMELIREENPIASANNPIEPYSKKHFLSEVFMTEEQFDSLTGMLRKKKNIILQGAPGVGKTFSAKRLAYALIGAKDESRIEMVQFHQNYSYEDFIMGYKPDENGFKLTNGIFYRFCTKAANDPGSDYFFIIDEINRGNMSKIFGELLMLIEADYRGKYATLAYNGLPFTVPKNVYIIGMMNTADRSLAMIDYALRRRFSFYTMEPGFSTEGFTRYQKQLANETFDSLIDKVRELNKQIMTDGSLGPGFRIGHSYFCGQTECTEEWLKDVVHYDLIPMLQEYWFDNQDKLTYWENVLSGVVDDQ